MSVGTLVYRVPGRNTTVTFKGQIDFDPCSLPIITKSEYGLDTMTIEYVGPAPKLAAFLATLTQGKRFDQNNRQWYLQTWTPDENPIWPRVSLQCVGFADGKTPKARYQDSVITQSITVAAVVTESQGDPPEDVEVAVTREVTYRALQTAWTYVSIGRPSAPKYGYVSRQSNPKVMSSVLTAVGGTTNARYNGANAPAPYVAATQPATVDFLLDFQAVEIFGTPYFECQEVVARIFVAP